MMPNQKLGIEMPKKPNIEPRLSAQEFGLAPAQTPSGMPKTIAISIEAMASSMVAGSRSPIKLDAPDRHTGRTCPDRRQAILARKRRY